MVMKAQCHAQLASVQLMLAWCASTDKTDVSSNSDNNDDDEGDDGKRQ